MDLEAHILAEVVKAFTRAIRAMGYYDADHPVFEQTRSEAHNALKRAWQHHTVVTIGCAGRHLVIDAEGTPLAGGTSGALADRMFKTSVVAIRLHEMTRPHDLGVLMKVLAESPDRVRAAGGVSALLNAEQAIGIDALEVDFAALFAGQVADLSPLVGGDPIAELALKEILRFKDEEAREGAVQVSLEKLATAESLGDFLDDLLDSAEEGVVTDAPAQGVSGRASGSMGSVQTLSGDDLADAAARAFFANQESITKRSGPRADLAQSAQILSGALVRLAPDARFALLRKLAGAEHAETPQQDEAVKQLAGCLDDKTIVETIAAALYEDQGDSDTVRAIGNLIRRIRPVEAERRKLMNAVDQNLLRRGKPIDGVLWQELQSRALENKSYGFLEMNLARLRPQLVRYAQARMAGKGAPVPGQDVLYSFDTRAVSRRAVSALAQTLVAKGAGEGMLERVEGMIEALHTDGDLQDCLLLLQGLMRRSEVDNHPALHKLLGKLLSDDRGQEWSFQLLRRGGGGKSEMMGQLILNALEAPGDRNTKQQLVQRLAGFGPEALARLVPSVSRPLRAQALVLAALQTDAKTAVKIGRMVLKQHGPKIKEIALKAMAGSTAPEVVSLLAHVAGWRGEKYPKALLALSAEEERWMQKLQLIAIGSMGLTRSPQAVKPLYDVLTQKRLFENKELEEVRLGAAQALLTHGSDDARAALTMGAEHKRKAIRDVCQRVLTGRR